MPIDVSMTNEEKVTVTIAPKTASGQPATVDGVPTWEILSGDVTTEPAADGLSCVIFSGGAGPSVVRATADADLGEGVRPLEDTVNVNVSGAEASSLGMTAGTPEPKEEGESGSGVNPNTPHPDQTLPGDLPGGGSARRGGPERKRK